MNTNNVVNGDMNELDKVANEAHNHETSAYGAADLDEL